MIPEGGVGSLDDPKTRQNDVSQEQVALRVHQACQPRAPHNVCPPS
jgi:hypothetical protein